MGHLDPLFVRLLGSTFVERILGISMCVVLHGAEFVFDFDDDNFMQVDADGSPMEILPNEEVKGKMNLHNVSVVMQGMNVLITIRSWCFR